MWDNNSALRFLHWFLFYNLLSVIIFRDFFANICYISILIFKIFVFTFLSIVYVQIISYYNLPFYFCCVCFQFSTFVPPLMLSIGIAVSFDYTLFLCARCATSVCYECLILAYLTCAPINFIICCRCLMYAMGYQWF